MGQPAKDDHQHRGQNSQRENAVGKDQPVAQVCELAGQIPIAGQDGLSVRAAPVPVSPETDAPPAVEVSPAGGGAVAPAGAVPQVSDAPAAIANAVAPSPVSSTRKLARSK